MNESTQFDDDVAAAYDATTSALGLGAALAYWVSRHSTCADSRVLDVGPLTGISSLALADAGAHMVVVESSQTSFSVLDSKRGDRAATVINDDPRRVNLDAIPFT